MDADVPAALAAIAAAAISHERFHAARAAAAGGEVRRCGGGVLTYGPDPGQGGWMNVFFVERPSQRPRAVADEVLDWIADLPPLRSVGWWTTGTEEHAPLAAALLARGFQWGWRPHWMWLDLTKPRPRFVLPSGIGTVRFPDGPGAPAAGLPEAVRRFGVGHEALLRLDPPSTTVFAAFDAAEVVGAVTLHVARSGAGDAPEPVGGIYDCWVVERARRRGIGAALTAAAADRAQALGCRLAVLNATDRGRPMYRRVGFRSAGWGRTWWLVDRQLRAPRPDAAMVRFVEAIGDGDPAELDRALAALASRPGSLDLDAELLCGETPLGVAARCGRTATARRLLDHGAHLDVLTAWDLGWKDVAADLLRQRPELANARRGETGATPLMVAIERGDEALARLVLSAGPDLHLTDLRWGADALGWAEHFGRQRLAAWIREAGRRGGASG